ncbi:hypothetical protein GDO78_015537 [Eleutherodactylus coqui]|uniref:Uncharacterized protein n=1 Tax=Eleutherodactylus coqui TaxID=57060 RepID=A0A8J6ELH5_ELECQ|nr:hypothetical protein GDO78_015537 [Eleutherodactylus coqui]
MRWLSRGKSLRCFYEHFDTVVEFIWPIDPRLCDAIKLQHLDVAYLTDIFDKHKEVSTKLQEDKMNFIKSEGIISSFIAKLDLDTNNLSRCELCQSPRLQEIACED